ADIHALAVQLMGYVALLNTILEGPHPDSPGAHSWHLKRWDYRWRRPDYFWEIARSAVFEQLRESTETAVDLGGVWSRAARSIIARLVEADRLNPSLGSEIGQDQLRDILDQALEGLRNPRRKNVI